MKKMIVLDAEKRGGKHGKTSNKGDKSSPSSPKGAARGVVVADALYPRERIRMAWPSVRKVGSGLANLGNTCFMNAVMQCLTHTPALASFCLDGEHRRFKPRTNSQSFSAIYEMGEHVCRALGGERRVVSPSAFVKNLRSISKTFRKGRQEDAHEFARCLLDAMHEKCVDAARPKPPKNSPRAETTFVFQVFGGRLRSQVTCKTCGRKSDTFDSFMDLSLDVAKAKSVESALKRYVAVEVLDGSNKYKCEMGGGKPHMTRATKQFTIDTAPLVLTVQLKRFEYVPFGRGKLTQFVEYPLALDISGAMSDANPKARGKEKYTLFAVLVHAGGSMHSGHYYCYVKSSAGVWYEMDDEGVSATSERTALGQKAYLLFYQREGTDLGAGKGHQGGGVDVKALKAAKREAIERAGVKVAREREESLNAGAADGDDKRARRVAPTRVNEVSDADDDSSDESYRAGDGDGSSSDDPSSSSSSESDSDSKASPTLKSSSLKSPTKYGKRGKLMSARERLAHKDLHALAAREKKHKRVLGLKKKKKGQDELSPVRTREGRKAAGLSPPRDEWQADELLRTAAKPSKEEKRAARRLKKEAKAALRETKKAAKKAALRETKKLALKKASRKHPENGDPDEEGDGLKPTAKDIRRWLNKEARVANVVGKGGRRSKLNDKQVVSAWDEDDERENASPANGEKEKPPPRPKFEDKKRKKDVSAPGKKGFKRQRTYDDLDEDYDRGRLSKHQRRKAEGRAKSGPGPKGGLKGKTTGLFDSAQSLKKEIADMEKFGERLCQCGQCLECVVAG